MTNSIKTVVLLAALSAVFLYLGQAIGGSQGLIMGFFMAALMNLGSYWFSDQIVLKMYSAREVTQGHPLWDVTARLAQRANLPMPKVYVIPQESPNAFATGRNPEHAAVAATEGILRILTPDELAGVIGHELAHVKHRDILISSVAATLAAAIMFVARFAMFVPVGRSDDRDEGSSPVALFAMMLLAPVAAMLIQSAISRSREFLADAGGAEISGNPLGLVNALRKLETYGRSVPLDASPATAHMFIIKPFTMSGLFSLFSTHPPTEQRVEALMALARR